jgi:hypothetical protein
LPKGRHLLVKSSNVKPKLAFNIKLNVYLKLPRSRRMIFSLVQNVRHYGSAVIAMSVWSGMAEFGGDQ